MITVKTREDFLKELKRQVRPNPFVAEIGCYRGDFSEQILQILTPYSLYLIDTFEHGGRKYGEELGYMNTSYSDFWDYIYISNRFKENESVKIYRGFSFELANKFLEIFHIIYHDASHLYEDLKRDLKDWLPKLRDYDGGIIAGHDYIEHPDFGVKQAVDEFCKEYNFEMIIYNENGGDYALKRKT